MTPFRHTPHVPRRNGRTRPVLLALCVIIILLGYLAAPAGARSESSTHIVQPGETLSQIALRYGLTTAELAQLNHIGNPNLVYVGQELQVVAYSESPAVNAATPTVYTIQPGDTLAKISRTYNISMATLQSHNNLINGNLIYVGQQLSIPTAETEQAPAVPVPSGAKQVIVDISEQRTYIYQGGQLLQQFVVSTGLPGQDTAVGTFYVQNKLPVGYAYTWGLSMPYWVGIYWAGPLQNGFHALPIDAYGNKLWAGLLGSPASYGCIILTDADAEYFYSWIDIGTQVVIQP